MAKNGQMKEISDAPNGWSMSAVCSRCVLFTCERFDCFLSAFGVLSRKRARTARQASRADFSNLER